MHLDIHPHDGEPFRLMNTPAYDPDAPPPEWLQCTAADCDGPGTPIWILHTVRPRFLAQSDDEGRTFRFIDWYDDLSLEPPQTLDRLMREISEWYASCLEAYSERATDSKAIKPGDIHTN